MSDAILAAIDQEVLKIGDPLQRLATGKLVDVYMPRDLELARQAGQLDFDSPRAARDLMLSCVNQAILSVIDGKAPREHLRQMLALGLRGIGAAPDQARVLSRTTLPHRSCCLPSILMGSGAERGGRVALPIPTQTVR